MTLIRFVKCLREITHTKIKSKFKRSLSLHLTFARDLKIKTVYYCPKNLPKLGANPEHLESYLEGLEVLFLMNFVQVSLNGSF